MHFVQILERKLAVQPFPYYLEYILHIYIYIGFGNILLHSQGVEWTFIIHRGWSGPLSLLEVMMLTFFSHDGQTFPDPPSISNANLLFYFTVLK